MLVANGQYIHQVFFEGDDATTLSNDLFETISGIDFIYKYDESTHLLYGVNICSVLPLAHQ